MMELAMPETQNAKNVSRGTAMRLSAGELSMLDGLASGFYKASQFLNGFVSSRFREIWEPLLSNGNGVIFCLMDEDEALGTIGGIIHRDIYGERLIAEEMFWFVDPSKRGAGLALYAAFEAWAKDKGAAEIQMVHLLDSMPEKVAAFYLRKGFRAAETRYVKGLQ